MRISRRFSSAESGLDAGASEFGPAGSQTDVDLQSCGPTSESAFPNHGLQPGAPQVTVPTAGADGADSSTSDSFSVVSLSVASLTGTSFPQETVTLAGSGLTFINTYDASVGSGYHTAILYAEHELESHFTNAVTIRVNFGFQNLGPNAAAQNSFFNTVTVSYATLKGALTSHATSADDVAAVNALPASAPGNSHSSSASTGFLIAAGEARILGLAGASNNLDDSMVLGSAYTWNFDPNNRAAAGGLDAIGAIEHEITEGGMGRVGGLGYQNNTWGPEDLFRFTSSGVRDYTGGQDGVTTYFSPNGGSPDLGLPYHNAVNASGTFDGQDPGDWSSIGDSFGAAAFGTVDSLSNTDIRLMDVLGWTSTTAAPPPPSLGPRVAFTPNDFNNDAMADVLWRNPSGTLADWTMNGGSVAGSYVTLNGSVVQSDPAWNVVGISDFNNDGKADILWRGPNGALAEWLMNGSSVIGSGYVNVNGAVVAPDASWSVAGVADLNGDGASDIIWRSSSGALAEWNMDSIDIIGSSSLLMGGTAVNPDMSWSIAGFGDFNADGHADILWRNTSGEIALWAMNGSNIVGGGDLSVGGVAVKLDASWSVAGIGDFNGDHKADVLWRNTDGSLVEWLMNGASIIGSAAVTFNGVAQAPGSDWSIVEIGDFTGDGKSDILWRSTSGAAAEWIMNGTQISSSVTPTQGGTPASPDPTWITQAKPTDFA